MVDQEDDGWLALERAARDLLALVELIEEHRDLLDPVVKYVDSIDLNYPPREPIERVVQQGEDRLKVIAEHLSTAAAMADPVKAISTVAERTHDLVSGLNERTRAAEESSASMDELDALLARAAAARETLEALPKTLLAAPAIIAQVKQWSAGLHRLIEMRERAEGLEASLAQAQQVAARGGGTRDEIIALLRDVADQAKTAIEPSSDGEDEEK